MIVILLEVTIFIVMYNIATKLLEQWQRLISCNILKYALLKSKSLTKNCLECIIVIKILGWEDNSKVV